jgi:hypothetical protein
MPIGGIFRGIGAVLSKGNRGRDAASNQRFHRLEHRIGGIATPLVLVRRVGQGGRTFAAFPGLRAVTWFVSLMIDTR